MTPQPPFERIVFFRPASDKRGPNPRANYGVTPVMIVFLLKGPLHAVQLALGTTWYPAHVQEEYRRHDTRFWTPQPKGWDLGYHADSKNPIEDYQSDAPEPVGADYRRSKECEWVPSGRCFDDGSPSNADPLALILLEEGSDGVWKALERYYDETFGEEVLP